MIERDGFDKLQAEFDKLRADFEAHTEPDTYCEGCGAPLFADDDFVTSDDVAGCWAAMSDLPSKRKRPCYAYRVGKPAATEANDD